MVRYGFSLGEVRGLYIDELYSYLEAFIEHLENEGILKEGSTDKIKGKSEVEQMRSQLSKFKNKQ
jgi:hypothetical protein